MPSLRHLLLFWFGLLALAAPAAATWSIVIVDLATGEVAIGIATCLTGFDLRPNTIVVVPGRGAAAAQSFVGPLSLRELIRSGFLAGSSSSQILAQLAATDAGHQGRQYGIVSLTGGAVTFTGNQAFQWAGGVTGQTGSLVYAIQGNILTGAPVVTAAELALQNTVGTLGDKLMAAMEAARAFGGDGRCSCSPSAPTSCGAPPASFTKSSHIGLMVWSRPSDLDAPCTAALGCGAGQYWMDLNVANQTATALDPVLQLQALYTTWKANQVGRPDHYQSTATLGATTLRADGTASTTATVWLRDAQGNPLGNARPLTVALRSGSTASGLVLGPVTAQPNGSYTFSVTAGFTPGNAILDVATTDSFGRVGIWPQPSLTVTDVFGACGQSAIGNGSGGVVDVLRVQGTAGQNRVVQVGYGQPFTIDLQAQPGNPPLPAGLFALWAYLGIPPAGGSVPLGGTNGALCYLPAPYAPTPTVLLADALGLGGVIAATSAPFSLPVPGVPALLDVALQGVMLQAPSLELAATNAVLLRLVPLPAPTITSVLPAAPTPGQNVTVQGTNFLSGLQATLAGAPLVVTPTSTVILNFVMPGGVPCDAPLVLTNLGGSLVQATVNATPVVSSAPSSGPALGGTSVVIIGQNLVGATVRFQGVPMTITAQFATAILGTLPPGTPGLTTLVVQNPNGCQTSRPFTYL
jgi:uncharacterized Ntn-hydrolase superfamily protein